MAPIAGYRVRRQRVDLFPGSPMTMYRVEVYNGGKGSKLIFTSRPCITKERALNLAAEYVKHNFTAGAPLQEIRKS